MRAILHQENTKSAQIERYLKELVPIPRFIQKLTADSDDWKKLDLESVKYILCYLTASEILQLRLVSSQFQMNVGMVFHGQCQYHIPNMKETRKLMDLAQQHKEASQRQQLTLWMKLRKDHFNIIIAFLDKSQILELRLVNTVFMRNIILCYPALLYQVRNECKQAQQHLDELNSLEVSQEFEKVVMAAKQCLTLLQKQHIQEIRAFSNPPPIVLWITIIIRNILIGVEVQNISYVEAKKIYQNPLTLIQQLNEFNYKIINDFQISEILRITEYEEQRVAQSSYGALCLYKFVNELRKQIDQLKLYSKVQKLIKAIAQKKKLEQIFNK